MSRESFGSFAEAIEYYQKESDLRYPVEVERDDAARRAVLRTGKAEAGLDAYVAIWPAKNWRGEVEPVRVWAEEY